MTKMMIILISVVAIVGIALLFVIKRHCGLSALWNYVRKVFKYLLSFAAVLAALCACLIFCYADITKILNTTMSADSIADTKNFIRLFTGIDSVFVALQAIAFSSFMVSLVSCIALIFGGVVSCALFFSTEETAKASASEYDNQEVFVEFPAKKSFLVYSKYNS